MIVVLAILVGVFACLSDHFFSLRTLKTIGNQIPSLALISVGMTFVLIAKGIDLSVGSVMALSGATIGILMVNHDCSSTVADTSSCNRRLPLRSSHGNDQRVRSNPVIHCQPGSSAGGSWIDVPPD